MFGQSLLSAFGIACTTNTDQLFDAVSTQLNSVQTYKLDGNATSISGTNNGSASNISWVTGKFGQAASFSSSSIGIGNLIGGNVYTYSFWVKPNSIASGVYGAIIGSSSPDVTYYQENSKLSIYNGSGSSYLTTSNIFLNTTDWVNIVAVATGSQILIYRNGVLSNTFNDTPANSQNIIFGKHPQYSVEYYSGLLDQVRIFNSALTQAQVTALYNETASTAAYGYITYDKFNSVAYYKMSDATDQLGNYNGTATNVNFNTEGKFGFAGAFNGLQNSSASYINISSSTTSTTSSVSLWFNTTVKDSNYGNILDAGGGSSANTGFAIIRMPTTGFLQVNFSGGTVGSIQSFTGSTDITDGNWHNIVLSMASDNTFVFYLDGLSHLSGTRTKFTVGQSQNLSINRFGTNAGSIGASSYGGSIDQVRIYNSALSAENVTSLYNEIECPAVAVTNAFNTVLYTGNSTNDQSITGVGFKPDFVWIKSKNIGTGTTYHGLWDSVRGTGGQLYSELTNPETNTPNRLYSFDSDGFSLGNGVDPEYIGNNNYVSWNWKAPLANLSTSFNGSSSYITTGLTLPADSTMTFSFWFQFSSNQSGSGDVYLLSDLDSSASGNRIDIRIAQSYSNQIYIDIGNGSSRDNKATGFIPAVDTWYNLVVTLNGTAVVMYINGTAEVSYTSSVAFGTAGADPIVLGKAGAYNCCYLKCIIGQVRIFDDVLTSSEVSDLYTEPAASNNTLNYPAGAGCIAAYPLETDAVDLSGNYNGSSSNVTFSQPGYLTQNTEGTTTSTVAANVDAGFSIVQYTAGGAANVGHGLDSAPELILTKNIDTSEQWFVYSAATGLQKFLGLNTTTAATSNSGVYTSVTDTAFTNNISSTSRTYINYCFHSVANYSKVGSYIGNGSTTGPIIYTGFRPRFIMTKPYSIGDNWSIWGVNQPGDDIDQILVPNNSGALSAIGFGRYDITLSSTGFQLKRTDSQINQNGAAYIFMAIA